MDEGPNARTLIDSMTDGGDAIDSFRLDRGTAVDRYVILRELGVGGMGVVYAAYDPGLDRKVALKLLHARTEGRRAQDRLVQEAQAIAGLRHPNVVAVHDIRTFESRTFVAMEFVEGMTLRAWLKAQPRTWSEVLTILRQAGQGLAAAHRKGIVHRDFKPDNVIVEPDGRAVVLDFGLARRSGTSSEREDELAASRSASPTHLTSPEASRSASHGLHVRPDCATETGARLGTPAYMAPEQASAKSVNARSDQFSFCVVAWEALYGVRPFAIIDEPGRGARLAYERAPVRPRSQVPVYIGRALERGLARAPEERHPSIEDLLDAFEPPRPLGSQPVFCWLAVASTAVLVSAAYPWMQRSSPVPPSLAVTTERIVDANPSSQDLLGEELERQFQMAVTFADHGAMESARAWFLAATARADASGRDELRAQGLVHLAWLHGVHLADLEATREWGVLATAAIERCGGSSVLETRTAYAIGRAAAAHGRHTEATAAFARALEHHRQRGDVSSEDFAETLLFAGRSMAAQGADQEARAHVTQAVVLYRSLFGPLDPKAVAASAALAELPSSPTVSSPTISSPTISSPTISSPTIGAP